MSDTSTGGRGGYRRPSSPAPVSGPGTLSARTDGGPAQPVRTATGLPYGQASTLEAGQQVAPLPQAAPTSTSTSTAPGRPAAPEAGASLGGVFSDPTSLPGEPVTAGAATGPGPGPASYFRDDPDELLREVYAQFPNDDLRALLEGRD